MARFKAMALVGAITIVGLTSKNAHAVVGEIASFAKMFFEEVRKNTEVGALVANTAATVKHVKEYAEIAKTVYRGIDELRHMTWAQLRGDVLSGADGAFPELRQMERDIDEARDLQHADMQALRTVRGALWEYGFGPTLDELHAMHADDPERAPLVPHYLYEMNYGPAVIESPAAWDNREAGLRVAQRRVLFDAVRREDDKKLEQWEEDCGTLGPGACLAAAQRATLRAARIASDTHATQMLQLEMQARAMANEDRRELDRDYAVKRLTSDINDYFAVLAGIDVCRPGDCLYERYGDKLQREIAQRRRHPATGRLPPARRMCPAMTT